MEDSGDDRLSRQGHYHGPDGLNGRVRNGNGCDPAGIVAGNAKLRWSNHNFVNPGGSVTTGKSYRKLSGGRVSKTSHTGGTRPRRDSGSSRRWVLRRETCLHADPVAFRRATGRGGQAIGCWNWSAEAVARLTLPAHRPGGLPGAFIACANGNLVLEGASRLDAFSAYPVPTWLPGGAPSGTAGTPEVGPPQSSRTRGDAPQVSCAHGR